MLLFKILSPSEACAEATPRTSRRKTKLAPRPQLLSIKPLSSFQALANASLHLDTGLWPGAPGTQVHVPFGNHLQAEKGTTTSAAFLPITQNIYICIFTFLFEFRFPCWGGWWKHKFQENNLLPVGRGKAFFKEEPSLAAQLPFELHWYASPCLFFLTPSAKMVAPLRKYIN